MIIASLLSLAIALYCYAISQLQQHGKLRWSSYTYGFWGTESSWLKYKPASDEGFSLVRAPNTWYYRLNNLKYKEKFFLSATILSFLTDGYHFMQFWFFNFLSLSIVLAIGFNWWLFLGVLFGTRVVHWSARQILSK